MTANALTYDPFRLLAMSICLPQQFVVHLVETLECIRYAIGRFEMVAEGAINCKFWDGKLQTNGMLSQRAAPEQKEILTFRAATKAPLHEPPVRFIFAHSFKSGVGDGEWKDVSTLLSGVERYRCMKSVEKCRMHSGGIA